jgi:DNA-binding transcriptional LysR family regulator
MQFSALRYFLETARLGSIRRAAEVLYVAPSAISRQIALLEQTYGMPLLERHAAGVRLTVAGEVFARQARATVRDFERLHSEIDDLQKLRRGTVRIFSVEPTVASVVYRAMAEFARSYPGITYEVQVAGGIRAIAALAAEGFRFVAVSLSLGAALLLAQWYRDTVLPAPKAIYAGR